MKHGLSIGLHVGGTHTSAPSPGGWPQFYIEDHQMLTHSMMNQATSLILEGVFDVSRSEDRADRGRLRLGAATRLAAGCALDQDARRGSGFATEAVGVSEDQSLVRHPARRGTGTSRRSAQMFEWIGWDRMVYSSDYPHWDFDDPHLAWRFQMTEVEKRQLLHDNALAVYSFK